jgi:hypothetical protein
MTQELYYVAWNPAKDYPAIDPARVPAAFKPALQIKNYGVGDIAGVRAIAKLAKNGGPLPPRDDVLLGFPNGIVPPNTFMVLDVEGWPEDQIKPAITAVANIMPASRFCVYGFYPAWPPGVGLLTPWVLDRMQAELASFLPWCKRTTNIVECYTEAPANVELNMISWQMQLTVLRNSFNRVGAFVFPEYANPPNPPMTPFEIRVDVALVAMLQLYNMVLLWAPLAASIDMMVELASE